MSERDNPDEQDVFTTDRRSILKTVAAASAAGVGGVSGLSETAMATSGLPYRFYSLHPLHDVEKLVGFNPVGDGAGTVAAREVATLELNGKPPGFTSVTLAFHPNGDPYGISGEPGETNQLFRIDTDTGEVTTVTRDPILETSKLTIPASAFVHDGDTPYLYFVRKGVDELARIKPDGTDPEVVGTLTLDDSFGSDHAGKTLTEYYGEYHTGLSVDFATDELFAIIHSVNTGPGQRDDTVRVGKDGTVTLVEEDVIDKDSKIGDEIDPCTGTATAIREGNDLHEIRGLFDEGETTNVELGEVMLGEEPLEVASLASPWRVENCGSGCSSDLVAGQHTTVGTVDLSLTIDITSGSPTRTLEVTYRTDSVYLVETHLAVVDGPEPIEAFPTAGNDNPKVGQFTHGDTYVDGVDSDADTDVRTDTFEVDVTDLEPPYYVAAHATVSSGETAWSEGVRFTDRGNWATYTAFDPYSDLCGGDSEDEGGSGGSDDSPGNRPADGDGGNSDGGETDPDDDNGADPDRGDGTESDRDSENGSDDGETDSDRGNDPDDGNEAGSGDDTDDGPDRGNGKDPDSGKGNDDADNGDPDRGEGRGKDKGNDSDEGKGKGNGPGENEGNDPGDDNGKHPDDGRDENSGRGNGKGEDSGNGNGKKSNDDTGNDPGRGNDGSSGSNPGEGDGSNDGPGNDPGRGKGKGKDERSDGANGKGSGEGRNGGSDSGQGRGNGRGK